MLFAFEHGDLVAVTVQLTSGGETGWAAADDGDFLARACEPGGQRLGFGGAVVGSRTLQVADVHGSLDVGPVVAARVLAGTRAGASQHGREHVVFLVDAVGLRRVAFGQGLDVGRYVGLGGQASWQGTSLARVARSRTAVPTPVNNENSVGLDALRYW